MLLACQLRQIMLLLSAEALVLCSVALVSHPALAEQQCRKHLSAPSGLMEELRAAQKQISDLKSEAAQAQAHMLITQAATLPSGNKMLAAEVANVDAKSLQVRLAKSIYSNCTVACAVLG